MGVVSKIVAVPGRLWRYFSSKTTMLVTDYKIMVQETGKFIAAKPFKWSSRSILFFALCHASHSRYKFENSFEFVPKGQK